MRQGDGNPLWRLAGLETRRYARHPLFIAGVLLTFGLMLPPLDERTSSFFYNIVSATGLGVLGLVAMASITRTSRALSRSAGATPVQERTQTGALALACLLPFAMGLHCLLAMWTGVDTAIVNPLSQP